MASIRNSISLQDRMTPVLRSILKSMDSTLKVMQTVDKQSSKGVQSKAYKRAEQDLKRSNNELIKMQNNLAKADKTAKNLERSTGSIQRNFNGMRSGGFNLTNLAAGLFLIQQAAQALQDMMNTPDTLNAIQYRLATYDNTSATPKQLFDASYKAAQASRSDLESTASLASRILISGATGGDGASSIRMAETLNKASFLGGSSSEESRRALLQLSQGLASGVLQGDELRAIREQAPGLTDIMSKGLSKMAESGELSDKFLNLTPGDLKELGSEGELTAARIIKAFSIMQDYVDESFQDAPKQFGQAMTMLGNVWSRFLKTLSDTGGPLDRINQSIWSLLEALEFPTGEKFMNTLARGIYVVVDAFMTVVDWIGAAVTWLSKLDNISRILESTFVALGIVATSTAVVMFASWLLALSPLILAIAAVAGLVYAFVSAGGAIRDVIGGILGGVSMVGSIIWDVAVLAVAIVGNAVGIIYTIVVGLASGLVYMVIAIAEMILHGVQVVVAILRTVGSFFVHMVYTGMNVMSNFVSNVATNFGNLGTFILGVLGNIAGAIDGVFGSNLSETIQGWSAGLDVKVDGIISGLATGNEYRSSEMARNRAEAGAEWRKVGADGHWSDLTKLFDKTDKVVSGLFDGESWNSFNKGVGGAWINPIGAAGVGSNYGKDMYDRLTNYAADFGLASLPDGSTIAGGDLDTVGKIKSDVNISDEDIKLLRDVAARDFLLNLSTVTPQANIKFGDVRETADVYKIIEVIENMVDEQLATSLVVD